MRGFVDRLGYPGSAWRRPMLWTLLSAFVTLAFALPPYAGESFGGRIVKALGFLVIGYYTGASWQKHRQVRDLVAPLGRVEWPADRG